MRIGFSSVDWSGNNRDGRGYPSPGGACNVRMVLPQQALARHGHETFIGTLISRRRRDIHEDVWQLGVDCLDHHPEYDLDVIVLQRVMNADLVPTMRAHRAAGFCPVVNDLDDWFYGISPKNQAFKASHKKENAEINIDHYRAVLGTSDAITCSTTYLARRMRAMLRVPIFLVPNAIDMSLYTPKIGDDGKGRTPTIGWVGAIPWRSGDLESAGSVTGAFCNEHGLMFHHAGAITLDDENEARRVQVEEMIARGELTPKKIAEFRDQIAKTQTAGGVIGAKHHSNQGMCVPSEYASTMFGRIDVGIVPLAPLPFNEAKSAIKGMEYAAAGVPFVAQATGSYVELRDEFGIGRTAATPRDWRRELAKMLDPEWRAEQRAANLAGLARLDIEARWSVWATVYAKIARDMGGQKRAAGTFRRDRAKPAVQPEPRIVSRTDAIAADARAAARRAVGG